MRRFRPIPSGAMAAAAVLGCGALAVVPASTLAAQERTRVAVRFELADTVIRLAFRSEGPNVERNVARLLADALEKRYGFLHFVEGGDESFRLTFSFDREEPDSGLPFAARGIWVHMTHAALDTAFYWLTLIDAGVSLPAVNREAALKADVAREFRRRPHAGIQQLLATVPVSRDALPRPQPPGFALPFTPDDLCLENQTRLELLNEEVTADVTEFPRYAARVTGTLTGDPEPPHERYRGGIFGRAKRAIGEGVVRAVYVVEPVRRHHCPQEPVPPPNGGAS